MTQSTPSQSDLTHHTTPDCQRLMELIEAEDAASQLPSTPQLKLKK